MTVRKTITLPDTGALLLERAAGPSQARAAGDYLAIVLQQRYAAWTQGLYLVRENMGAEKLRAALEALTPHNPTAEDRVYGFTGMRGAPKLVSPQLRNAFCDVLLEYNARNQALLEALKGD